MAQGLGFEPSFFVYRNNYYAVRNKQARDLSYCDVGENNPN